MNTYIYVLTHRLIRIAMTPIRILLSQFPVVSNRLSVALLFFVISMFAAAQPLELNEPLIGAQVVIESGQSAEEIEALFAILKANSMQLCRIRMFESYMPGGQGNRDFSTFDIAFRAAERYEIKIFATLFPMVEFTNIGGFKFPDSEAHLASVSAYIRDVVTHFKHYKSLAGWVLLNEIGSGKAPFDKSLTAQQFDRWKKEDVVQAFSKQGKPQMQFQEERFLMDYNSWYLSWLKSEVRKYDQHSHLHVNTHAIFDTYSEYNFTKWRDVLDSFGGSAHASWHFGNFDRSRYHYAMAINSEMIRSGAGSKPWLMTELQGGNNLWSGGVPLCPTPQEIKQWMWTVIGTGAKGMIFWSLNARSAGVEAGEWALLDLLNQPSERMIAASQVAEVVKNRADLFTTATVVESGVNILYTRESLWSERRAETAGVGYAGRLPGGSIRSAIGFYETFAQLGIQANVKCMDEFDFETDAANGKVIVLAHQIAFPSSYTNQLKRFVSNGGTLIVEGLTGFFNEWMQMQTTADFPLSGLLGGKLTDAPFIAEHFTVQLNNQKLQLPAHLWEGRIHPATATPLARNASGEVVAVTHAPGAGNVIWIPSMVSIAAREKKNYLPLVRFVERNIVPSLQPASPRFKRYSPGMLMHTLRTENGYLVVLINKNSKPQTVELIVPTAVPVRELTNPTGKQLKSSPVFRLLPEETKVIEFQ